MADRDAVNAALAQMRELPQSARQVVANYLQACHAEISERLETEANGDELRKLQGELRAYRRVYKAAAEFSETPRVARRPVSHGSP